MLKPIVALAALALSLSAAPAPAATAKVAEEPTMCANVLNFLPRIVRREQVAAIQPGTRVVLHAICPGEDLFDLGNAAGLSRTIAANPALADALARHGFRADDVIAIAIRGGAVDLYVHRF
jgi:hypothetical protein